MTLPELNITYVDHRYREDLGIFITLLEVKLVKKRRLFRNKYVNKYRYFWRPTRQLADKKLLSYFELGNNRMPFINVWYEILSDINSPSYIYGHPDIDRIYLYKLRKVKRKGQIHNALMTTFSIKVLPF